MSDPVLLHLTTPTEWRVALGTGALTPSSLAEVGFVHLSSPEQAHLPADRLFPGRRDVVALVVDPARLDAPVRWEPGVPGDPASMRFPHLYGPLPTPAVVAVVPWRPAVVTALPAPGDAAGRAAALAVSLPTRRAAEVRDVPGGFAVLDPAFPLSRADNRLLFPDPVGVDAVEELTAAVATAAGLPERAATLLDPDAAPVAGQLARRGWEVAPAVLMARRLDDDPNRRPAPARAEEVPQVELHDLWAATWRRELAGSVENVEAVVAQLVARERDTDRVVRVVDLAVRAAGRPVAAGQLRIDGATAELEAVVTEPAARRQGGADAVLARATALARASGCDLLVLRAAALDWPRHWYARRGFAVVGNSWDVARPASARGLRSPAAVS